jgi:prophage protein|nr:MAG TPA: IrrE protein [Caudoviricetes sp.]
MSDVRYSIQQLEAMADLTLANFQQTQNSLIDVVFIANELGYSVLEASFKDDVSGMVISNGDDEKKIYINKDDQVGRQRFTIAHEIGHILLHQKDNKGAFVDYRNKTTYDHREFEADNFAAALLMPKDRSIELWNKLNDVDDFAGIMGVSKAAASIRLMNLGLI